MYTSVVNHPTHCDCTAAWAPQKLVADDTYPQSPRPTISFAKSSWTWQYQGGGNRPSKSEVPKLSIRRFHWGGPQVNHSTWHWISLRWFKLDSLIRNLNSNFWLIKLKLILLLKFPLRSEISDQNIVPVQKLLSKWNSQHCWLLILLNCFLDNSITILYHENCEREYRTWKSTKPLSMRNKADFILYTQRHCGKKSSVKKT